MGHDRYLVAHTAETLLLGDLASCKLSEVRVVILVYKHMATCTSLAFVLPWSHYPFRLLGRHLEGMRGSTLKMRMLVGCGG